MSYDALFANQVEEFLQHPDAIVLDHRDEQSYANGHIQGAKQITDSLLMRLIKQHRASPILVYCYHGNSSREIAGFLVHFGCKNVYNLEGGYTAWASNQSVA